LDKFAKSKNFDPLVSENWYSVKREEIFLRKGGRAVLSYYKNNPAKALIHLYPEVTFEKLRFQSQPYQLDKPDKRKRLFTNFALKKGFDPLIPNNWYSVSRDEILAMKGASALLRCYNRSMIKALVSLFPNIGLTEHKFAILPHNFWQETQNRRDFFVQFAKEKRFDALVPSNWYPISLQNLIRCKGASTVLRYYQGNFVVALQNLFPDLEFDKTKFVDPPNHKVPIGKLSL